jgi:hypothetical protein
MGITHGPLIGRWSRWRTGSAFIASIQNAAHAGSKTERMAKPYTMVASRGGRGGEGRDYGYLRNERTGTAGCSGSCT